MYKEKFAAVGLNKVV